MEKTSKLLRGIRTRKLFQLSSIVSVSSRLCNTVNCFVFNPGRGSSFFVNAHPPGRNQISGRGFFFSELPRGGIYGEKSRQRAHIAYTHKHTHTYTQKMEKIYAQAIREKRLGGRIKRHTHGAASPQLVLDRPTLQEEDMRNDSGSSCILFGRRGLNVVVAGRSGPRVGCVDVVFDCSVLKPTGGRLVFV